MILLALRMGEPGSVLAQRPLGTDVSGYQPTINWPNVKSAGVSFAWSKATEGTYYMSPDFVSQVSGAKSVGIPIGAYHYARPSTDPNITGASSAQTEAAFFWAVVSNYVKNGGAYLVPMLDWEDVGATNQFPAATMSAWVNEWCNTVSNYARSNGLAVRPVVYTGTWYSAPSSTYSGLTTAVTNWPSWLSAYPNNPNPQTGSPGSTYPWPSWNIWQYADTNWSGGDADVFNGTWASFAQMFVIGGTNAPVITLNPTNVTVLLGSNTTFAVRAAGQTPLAFQWQFNGTNIAGATSTNYTITNAQLTDAGRYVFVVSNSYGAVLSTPAFLSVLSQLTNAPGCMLAPSNLADWYPAEGNPFDYFGTYNGAPQNGFSYVTGKQGLAFHFDGSTAYLYTGAPSLPPPWTACFWVNRQNAPGSAAALCGDGVNELKLEQYKGTRQVGFTILGSNDWVFNYSAPVGIWTHLAFVGTPTGTTIYANGVFVGTTNISLPLPRAYIGAGYVPSRVIDYMLGGLDETMFFNRALSAAEIDSLYQAGSGGLYRAPVFTSITSSNGETTLSLSGITGKSFTVYSSPDLSTWTSLGNVANPAGAAQFIDSSPSATQTFYRATQP
ncbi:Glycoside hydrolase family 25 [Verrucomicrobia bacterium]|nr:Glycoside hydrolase family 25 [Verrucomicrobiota bacterium]